MEDNLDIFAENTAQFDAYLRGDMPPEARVAFEARLAADAPFRDEFDLHRALLGSLKRNQAREHWRERLRASQTTAQPTNKPAISRWWLLALLLVLAGGLYWFLNHDDIGKHAEPVVPIAGQPGTDPQPPPYGADGIERIALELTVLRIIVRDGKKTAAPGDFKATLEIFKTEETQAAGNIRGDRVQLYLPEKQYKTAASYQLIRLLKDGVEKPILQIGTDFYTLPAADGYLEKIVDAEVLRWLQ